MTRRRAEIGAAVLVAVLVVLQLALPELAERRLTGDLDGVSGVRHVEVHAFPAVKLLFGRADSVDVRLGSYDSKGERLADFLSRADSVDRLDASAATLKVGPLRLREARMRKRGDVLRGSASVRDADLARAFPVGFRVEPLASAGGRLVLRGTISLFGARAGGEAEVSVRDGRIVVAPRIPFGGLLSFEVFGDERLAVQSVGARDTPGGFSLSASGRIRD